MPLSRIGLNMLDGVGSAASANTGTTEGTVPLLGPGGVLPGGMIPANSVLPAGVIITWIGETPPTGFLELDGSAVSRSGYASLFSVFGTRFGAGDGTTTFNLPDLRGEFLRGWDHGRGADPDAAVRTNRGDGTTGDVVGTKQTDAFKSHTHTANQHHGTAANHVSSGETYASHASTATGATGGNETRPRNVSVMYCVKY